MNVPHVLARRQRKRAAKRRAKALALEAPYLPRPPKPLTAAVAREIAKIANFGNTFGLRMGKSSISVMMAMEHLRSGKSLLMVNSEYQPKTPA